MPAFLPVFGADLESLHRICRSNRSSTDPYIISVQIDASSKYSNFTVGAVGTDVSGTFGTIAAAGHTLPSTRSPWRIAVASASNVSVAYTKIGDCRHTDFAIERGQCTDSNQPYLTMPSEPNTLKVTVLDNFGMPILHGLDVTATFNVLNGNVQKALNMINHTVTRTDPSGRDNLTSYGVYFVNFFFGAPEEFEYEVTIHVGNLSNTVQHLTPVRYMYALHQPLLDSTCLEKPFSVATSAVYAPVDTDGTPSRTDGCAASLNSSACAALGCIYIDGENSDLEMQRCALAGCMYRAGKTKNRVVWVVEDGFWHRYNGYEQVWEPTKISAAQAFSIEMNVSRVDITCSTVVSDLSESDRGSNATVPLCPDRRTVYWRECDTANSSTINPLTTKTFQATRGGNPERFTVEFDVAQPGTYWLATKLRVEQDPLGVVLSPHVEVVISPGALDLTQSPLLQPNLTEPGRRPTKPQDQNPRGGPQTKSGGAMTTWVQYNLTLAAKDDRGNPRDSSDEMFVVIQHQNDGDLKDSGDAQQSAISAYSAEHGEKKRYSECYATQGLITRLHGVPRNQWPPMVGDAATVCSDRNIQLIVPGAVCDQHTAGVYTVKATFDNTYGVFSLNAWVCDGTQVRSDSKWDLSTCVGSDLSSPQYIGMNPGIVNSNERHNMPMSFTVCPANSATSSGKWGSTGFAEGPVLNSCQCQAGYMGRKGETCSACPTGKFTRTQGAPVCVDCPIGTHCSCETSGNCGEGGELPACRVCQNCPAGKYQRLAAQSVCSQCPVGFNCADVGLTYPVAFEGTCLQHNNSFGQLLNHSLNLQVFHVH